MRLTLRGVTETQTAHGPVYTARSAKELYDLNLLTVGQYLKKYRDLKEMVAEGSYRSVVPAEWYQGLGKAVAQLDKTPLPPEEEYKTPAGRKQLQARHKIVADLYMEFV